MWGFLAFTGYILGTTVAMTTFFIVSRHRIILKRIPDRYLINDTRNQDRVLDQQTMRGMNTPMGPQAVRGMANRVLNTRWGVDNQPTQWIDAAPIRASFQMPSIGRKAQ